MGSLVGGLMQTVTFVVGIKALLLIVAALYVCAWLTRSRKVTTAGAPVTTRAVEERARMSVTV